MPIDALINLGFGFVIVTFDRNLKVGPLNSDNWGIRFGNFIRPVILAQVAPGAPNEVAITFGMPTLSPGPDAVSYFPPPFDVLSDVSPPVPAAAFTGFPLHT